MRNPQLYNILKQAFGRVRVQNQGVPYKYTVRDGAVFRIHSGEEYCVCCPFCGDTRFRLAVNHMFGVMLPEGIRVIHAAHCWNENCAVIGKLLELVGSADAVSECAVSVNTSTPVNWEDLAVENNKNYKRLEKVIPVDKLSVEHPAYKYLVSRKLDPALCYKYFKLLYCSKGSFLSERRIIFPVTFNGLTVGYQARGILGHTYDVESKHVPKYYTCKGFNKSYFVYNYDNAKNFNFVVVVEGPVDVLKFGLPAVAIMGKSLSEMQARLIVDTWEGPIYLYGDPGFANDWQSNLERLQGCVVNRQRCMLYVPEDRDAGATPSRELWDCISEVSVKGGYNVDFTRAREVCVSTI